MVHPDRRVVCVEGDSAFGFSGMELETACRYKLPIIFIIINNNGIYGGLDPGAVPARRSTETLRTALLTQVGVVRTVHVDPAHLQTAGRA